MNWIDYVFAAFFVDQLMVVHFLGASEFLKDGPRSARASLLTLLGVLLVPSAVLFWWVHSSLLVPLHLTFLDSPMVLALVGIFSTLVGLLEGVRRWWPSRWLLTHSFLIGGTFVLAWQSQSAGEILVKSVTAVVAYGVLLALLTAVDKRLEREQVPGLIRGLPLSFVTLGLVWLIFHGLKLAFTGHGA